MSTVISVDAVYAAVDKADLALDLPDDPELQRQVNDHFRTVFDTWAATGTVEPYGALAEDGISDEHGLCVPPGVTVDYDRGRDIFSACAHTIRRAIERVYAMPHFTFEVIETRQYEVEYTVDAATREEALRKAATGDTVDEVQGRCTGVTDRYVEA